MRPPLDRGIRWCGWQARAGWWQPGKRQRRSRKMTNRRRCAGMVSVGGADVQRQDDRGGGALELAGAQPRGQPFGAGQQFGGVRR